MRAFLPLALCVPLATACRDGLNSEPPSTAPIGGPPVVDHARTVAPADGREVLVVGRYVPVAIAKKMSRPDQPSASAELGHVIIEIDGDPTLYDRAAAPGTAARIALGRTARPAEEITRFRAQRVIVKGRLVVAPVVDNPHAASSRPMPVLHDPLDLRPAP